MRTVLKSVILGFVILTGCVDTDIIKDYTAAEVELMLTAGDKKRWALSNLLIDGEAQIMEGCADSVYWLFQMVNDDSVATFELKNLNSCTVIDTSFAGAVSASVFETQFTDSLLIEGDNLPFPSFMKVREIRPSTLGVDYNKAGQLYQATYSVAE
ncbi:hypothetical protein [Marinoscillum sp. MHG1-6]|uniref:hypothetical protein n=1 Tax=Marinoscillum sp. MHG1-6 TaxID=2959627 RepID=UPI002158665D|nr:hypothetical protein [Marinoscillum sp. MHG1-6]